MGRVEEERREYFEEMARLNDLLRAHENSAKDSKDLIARLETDLKAERKARVEADELAESRLQVNSQGVLSTVDSWFQPTFGDI